MEKLKLKPCINLRRKFNECALSVLSWPFRVVEAVHLEIEMAGVMQNISA
jgi:hypothetical protein